jgi:hypothetical protein
MIMQRRVAKFVKSHSNRQWPVAWAELVCGHTTGIRFTSQDDKFARAHDESCYLTKIGDEVPCERCDWQVAALQKLHSMRPGDLSHSRFRSLDSRGFGPGNYYVYGHDPKGPSGVRLLFSLEATPEADEALRSLQASPLSPTEKR